MNIQVKQRIVGIIIVIALIALLVPFLFVSKKNKDDTLKLALPESQDQKIEAPVPLVSENAPAIPSAVEQSAPKELVKSESIIPQIPKAAAPVVPVVNTAVPVPVPAKIEPAAESNKVDAKSTDDLVIDSLAKGEKIAAPTTPANTESIIKQEQNVMDLAPKPQATKDVKDMKNTKDAKNAKKGKTTKTTKSSLQKSNTKVLAKNATATQGLWSIYLGDFPEAEQNGLIKKLHDFGYRAYSKKMKTPDGAFVGIYVGHLRTQKQAKQLAEEIQRVTGFNGKAVKEILN